MSKQEILSNPEKFESVLKAAFKDIDQDGNGQIDFDELSSCLSDFSEDEVKSILKKLDNDKNGRISFAEFKSNIKLILDEILQ